MVLNSDRTTSYIDQAQVTHVHNNYNHHHDHYQDNRQYHAVKPAAPAAPSTAMVPYAAPREVTNIDESEDEEQSDDEVEADGAEHSVGPRFDQSVANVQTSNDRQARASVSYDAGVVLSIYQACVSNRVAPDRARTWTQSLFAENPHRARILAFRLDRGIPYHTGWQGSSGKPVLGNEEFKQKEPAKSQTSIRSDQRKAIEAGPSSHRLRSSASTHSRAPERRSVARYQSGSGRRR
ncbi:hypothetical protein B0A48_10732 [Cryoendolithus antarcticus]|uniref:Uncharacterized protein n=1 Tax=Cryoendolithus antarcticus TaxID=1507870 RepID=A0A1V8SY92_9PEZI|nr:hypothetical protein B0A48_10732 [Cryoendolithus antarcticus]